MPMQHNKNDNKNDRNKNTNAQMVKLNELKTVTTRLCVCWICVSREDNRAHAMIVVRY